jgi:hypothetical protein
MFHVMGRYGVTKSANGHALSKTRHAWHEIENRNK